MTQNVANAGDILPTHILVLRFEFTAKVAAGFGSPQGLAPEPIVKPRIARSHETFCPRWPFRSPGCFQACRGYGAEETGPALKKPRGLSFNPLANKRVQSLARGQVDADS